MIQTHSELRDWLRLLGTPGVGNDTARRLLQAFGLPAQVLAQPPSAWRQVVSDRVSHALARVPDGLDDQLQSTWHWLQAAPSERAVLALGDTGYPQALLHTPDPPCLLYVQGRLDALATWRVEDALAIVGSRNPTPQGRLNAQAFAHALAAAGRCIVSGLALGVDGAAHEGALQAAREGHAAQRLFTVAVVGTGLDRVYPRHHQALAAEIVRHGLLLSEYPLGTLPLQANFPRRNRIISGLSQGVLVVEAALESGSLITARQALEQGREVLAIPGSIHSPQSKGCHALIRQGALLVESARDVLDALQGPDPLQRHEAAGQVPLPLTDAPEPAQTRDPLLALLGHDPCSLDALQERSGLQTADLQARLLELELGGEIERLPGGRLQRLVRA
jgi:DNA processing protein